MSLGLVYFRRYRMEIELRGKEFYPRLPTGYYWVPWADYLCETHARTKFESFRYEIDAELFPCFTELDGCRRLMNTISSRDTFLPAATWLIAKGRGPEQEFCGTIQGIKDARGAGAIQNVGVVPNHRSRGLGTSLLQQALAGFKRSGLRTATLEVTAKNVDAVRLYERLGFCRVKSVYKTCGSPTQS